MLNYSSRSVYDIENKNILLGYLFHGVTFNILGHMVPLEDNKQIAFLGSPYFESISDLLSSQRFLNNIPQDQITMEIMFMNEQRRADVEMRYS